jgi:anti-anti-sigma factor
MAPTATPPNAWALHSVTQPDNVVELRPSGSLDASTACFLHARLDALVRSGYDEIIVNCRHLQHIDAAGVAPIRHIAEIFDQLGGRLTLLGLELSIDGLGEGVLPFAS